MRVFKIIRESGPYQADSCADGTIRITPMWRQFPKWNEQDGGGPGLSTRMNLAARIEQTLNRLLKENE